MTKVALVWILPIGYLTVNKSFAVDKVANRYQIPCYCKPSLNVDRAPQYRDVLVAVNKPLHGSTHFCVAMDFFVTADVFVAWCLVHDQSS